MSRFPIRRRAFLAGLGVASVAGCLGDDDGGEPTPGYEGWTSYQAFDRDVPALDVPEVSPVLDPDVETIVSDLEIPWDLSFAPDGELYMAERVGRLNRVVDGETELVLEPANMIPTETKADDWWVQGAEGGLLGVAVSPTSEHLFVYYTADVDGDIRNQIVRYDRTDDDVEATAEVIVDDIPTADEVGDPLVHNGGRLTFGPDGYLWATTGDAQQSDLARDPGTLNGKLLRLTEDGEGAPDNPDHGGDPRVYTGGHRNPQGIAWLSDDRAVISEHGPNMRDEISLVYPGGDYGWNDVRGRPGDDEYGSYADHPDVVPPVVHKYGSTWAPSGATVYTGDDVPSWRNRLLVASLAAQCVLVVTLRRPGRDLPPGGEVYTDDFLDDAYDAAVHQALVDEIGRIRLLEEGPDGELYAITSNWDARAEDPFPLEDDDRLVRIRTEADASIT